jgi:hypothetical protein
MAIPRSVSFTLEDLMDWSHAEHAAVVYASSQLAGNLVTTIAALAASAVYIWTARHANRVRDLTFIATQRHLLSVLARNLVPEDARREFDADELLLALEQTAHAFNTALVGRIAVDYLEPEFLDVVAWALANPAVRDRWKEIGHQARFGHLRSFLERRSVEMDIARSRFCLSRILDGAGRGEPPLPAMSGAALSGASLER